MCFSHVSKRSIGTSWHSWDVGQCLGGSYPLFHPAVSSQTFESSHTRIKSGELIRRGSAMVYVIEIFENPPYFGSHPSLLWASIKIILSKVLHHVKIHAQSQGCCDRPSPLSEQGIPSWLGQDGGHGQRSACSLDNYWVGSLRYIWLADAGDHNRSSNMGTGNHGSSDYNAPTMGANVGDTKMQG